MPTVIQAITPKKFFTINKGQFKQQLRQNLNDFSKIAIAKLQVYPPQQTKSKTRVKDFETLKPGGTGRARSGYKRTGELRRGWKRIIRPDASGVIIYNNAVNKGRHVSYAIYVQGPRGRGQRPDFRRRGWVSVTDVARETKKDFATVAIKAIKANARQAQV
jgi:hypothetical protein